MIAGTTKVGVKERICGGTGEIRRAEVLVGAKVVLEKDIVGDGKCRWWGGLERRGKN
jgi:hypothetical protein